MIQRFGYFIAVGWLIADRLVLLDFYEERVEVEVIKVGCAAGDL